MKIVLYPYYYDMLCRLLAFRRTRDGEASWNGSEPQRASDVQRFAQKLLESSIDRLVAKQLGIESDSAESMWWRLHSYWVSDCGMPPLRDRVPVDEDLLLSVLDKHGVDGIIESMDNFRKIYTNKMEYAWIEPMDFDEFLARGVEDFRTRSDPFNRYRRIMARDRERFLDTKPRRRKVSLQDLDKLGSILEYRIARHTVGKNI